MKFITSISPRRIERQQYCMATWLQYGEIIAVQTAGEIPLLQPHFPDVQFVATEKTGATVFGYPSRVNISTMIDQGPGLIINSEIAKLWIARNHCEHETHRGHQRVQSHK